MNTHQINGARLGNGATDHRSFLELATTAVATTSMLLIAAFAITGVLLARAVSSLLMSGKVYVTAAVTAAANASITLSAYIFVAVTGSTLGQAAATLVLTPYRRLTGTQTCAAVGGMTLSRWVAIATGVTAGATSTIDIISGGHPAPQDRSIWIANEPRTMVVL